MIDSVLKNSAVWGVCLLALFVSACNDYEYTPVTITMVNQSDSSMYILVEHFESINTSTLVAAHKSRTFYQVFTFTEEHPQTHLTIYATKYNNVFGAVTVLVNKDTTQFTAAYSKGVGITLTQKE